MDIPPPLKRQAIIRTLIRLAVLAGFILVVNFGVNWLLGLMKSSGADGTITSVIILSLILYAVLMAIPFVPGVEIGISLLMIQGAVVAPYVFLATFTGLSFSFLLGRYLPYTYLHRIFADLGMRKACALLENIQGLDQRQRLDLICKRLPKWAGTSVVRYRYLTVAVALNIPGNSIIGGGGGIALIAGLSGLFSPVVTLITFAIAVYPVALAVYLYGAGFLG